MGKYKSYMPGRTGRSVCKSSSGLSYSMLKCLFLLYLCIFASLSLSAAENADSAYAKGDYLNAISLWQRQIKSAGVSSELFYNLGNAYSKAGNPGAAVLNYKKSLKLNPNNSDAKNNLRYTEALVLVANESQVGDKTLDPTPEPLTFFNAISHGIASLGSNFWAILTIVCFLLMMSAVVIYVFVKNVRFRKIGFFGAGILFLMSGAMYACAYVSRSIQTARTEAVVMDNDVAIYASPSVKSKKVAAPLSAGTVVRLLGVHNDKNAGEEWSEIYLNADYAGWVPSSSIEAVSADFIR